MCVPVPSTSITRTSQYSTCIVLRNVLIEKKDKLQQQQQNTDYKHNFTKLAAEKNGLTHKTDEEEIILIESTH